jgi:sulfatase modifying factor 1
MSYVVRLTTGLALALAIAIAACGKATTHGIAGEPAAGPMPPSLEADASMNSTTHTTSVLVSHPQPSAEPSSPSMQTPAAEPSACPAGMILVEGEYCPNVEQTCLEWLEPPGDPYEHFRCKRYKEPATCKGPRVHKHFCIDEKERSEPGGDLPYNHMSWTSATKLCESAGARLCKTSEWQFACEGEEMRPYPYGWERDSTACNVDVMQGLGKVGRLVDHRTPASAHPRCVSAFGVHDMAGNVDEWATVDGAPRGSREVMKGSWWLPGRHACRSFQGGHGANYGGTESGARCCADAADEGTHAAP